ncbi:hypothetical protein HBI81_166310 [Parastagonospora nodorum]|nr:hypothetical protein HBH53_225180 [Parastagonospora nodorum]KAH3967384.1 hypothetical protein HBH52_189680 [Parastagonospora nodorum]KAH3994035.1 hypothetical protein HBI10_194800 [Parastagonospora nodorum]KAH4008678.1 hypothetical protein HBI13_231170 [Parastagonospora nodorum]KAH4112156.1 hypothetical protein HBH47_230300 [Parastagonospora nodorum]
MYAQMLMAFNTLTGDVLEPPKPTKDGLLKPQEPIDAIDNHDTAAQKWQDILARFEKAGLTEACTAFRMCLDRLQDLSLGLPTAGVLYQFIFAIADTYPEYARSICRGLRSKRKPTLDAVGKELNDESRRDDIVKTAFASNNQQQGNDINNQGGGQQPAPPTMTTSPTTPAPTHFNNLLMGLRQRAVPRIAGASMPALTSSAECLFPTLPRPISRRSGIQTSLPGPTAPPPNLPLSPCRSSRNSNRVVPLLLTCLAPSDGHVSEIPEQTKRLAAALTTRTALSSTRAQTTTSAIPMTALSAGGGMVEVQASGTIKLAVLRADSGINALTFSGVLYAPDMFVSLSHRMVRAKGCYCHGWREKLYRAADDLELAYTPDIDGVPNLLQVEDENDLLSAVRAMSFVLQHGSHSSHVLPTRKELHETFGHTDVNQLRKLAATTTCIEPTNTSRFACEVCMISNSRLQISRVVPDRATRLFQRVHVDLAGLISPPGLNGERYWSLYTDDLVCHRSIDLSPAKEGFGRSLIDYIVTVKTQYGV